MEYNVHGLTDATPPPPTLFCAKRASKIIVPPKEMLLLFSNVLFLTTMMSEIESTRSTQYTPLYENEQFESRISQWKLLISHD